MIEVLVTGLWYGINTCSSWCGTGWLRTGFDGDKDGIQFGLDEGIEIGFQIYLLKVVVTEILSLLWQDSEMVSMVL